jgi:membrane protease YdiL (CAAX protease family)
VNVSIRTWCKQHPTGAFFILSYAIAWAIWIPTGVLAPHLLPVLSLPGAWAPTVSAIALTGMIEGKAGVRSLLRRALLWRVGVQWYAVAVFGVALIGWAAIALHVALGGTVPQPDLPSGAPAEMLPVVLPILFLSNVFVGGPIAEELGWRGYAQPRLQVRIGALAAGLVTGVAWGLWHLPFFLFAGGASVVGGMPFVWYALLVTAWSVLMAWVCNHTRGSVLLAILFHAAINTTLGSLGLARTSEGNQLVVLNVALTWVVVAAIAILFGPAHLVRGRAAGVQNAFSTPHSHEPLEG